MTRLTGLLAPIVAGIAAALGQAPWGLWPLALVGFALGVWAVARARWPALVGLVFGVAHFGLALVWIVEPFLVDAAATAWLAPVALGAMALGFGAFWSLGGWLGARYLGGPVGVALGLAGMELLRAYALTGFPWALPGHVLIASSALPAASWLGAHGLGLAVLLGAGLVALARPAAFGLGIMLWAAPLGLGLALPPAPEAGPEAPVLRLVQPNAPQHLKWDPDWIGVFFRRGLAETTAPGARVATIWPETSMPTLLGNSTDVRRMIATAAGAGPVVLGVQRFDEAGQPRNALVLLEGAAGEVTHLYDKHRLVPFGEYLPLPRLFGALGFGPLAAQLAGRYAPGDGPATLDLPGVGPVLAMICYEAIFPQDLRRVDRPRAILHLTNDAWFGTRIGPQQHLALARLRAAESGLPLMRAANTGISAVIDARGDIRASLALGAAGHLDAALPPALPPTPYMRTGDWGAFLVWLALVAVLFTAARRNAVAGTGIHP